MTKSGFTKKFPWPTDKAMIQVYENQMWGSGAAQFYSGEGSHNPEIVEPYVEIVTQFLMSHSPQLSVLDLGCGDFNIGSQLVEYSSHYVAVDIVPDLIKFNQNQFKFNNLEFLCLDIATDELPDAEVVILRQVLQHLSNDEIKSIVSKLSKFRYVILTEHIPAGEFESNVDIISGQGIRLKKGSGVDLLQSPFNLVVSSQKGVFEYVLPDNKGRIVTSLYEF